jgi:hypothetical protein
MTELIEQTLRQWDDYAAIEDEERFECVTACVERQGIPEARAARMQPEALVVGSGYTVSSLRRMR